MNWWQYLLLVNIYLVLFYGFYALLLRRETFFQLNRLYLVSATLLSFFIPVIQADWVKNLFITQRVQYTIYGTGPTLIYHFSPIENTALNIGELLAGLYLCGVLFLTLRLVWQLLRLNKIIRQPKQATAYSFFKKIKLTDDLTSSNVIAAHEQVHAKQWHSADVLIIEAVMIINWFNPVVYFYRRAIKHIHEFIADNYALEAAGNKADYALLLLSQTFNAPTHGLVNHFFNHSLLKQRIIMLQKDKSQRIKLVKYGLSAPMFVLMMILSSATVNNSRTLRIIDKKATQVFLMPADVKILSALTTVKGNVATRDSTAQLKIASTNKKIDAAIVNEIGNARNTAIAMDTTRKKSADSVNALIKQLPGVRVEGSGQITAGGQQVTSVRINGVNYSNQVFAAVETEPTFPGGIGKFYEFVNSNLRYPAAMREHKVQGKVIVTFVVEKDGSLSDIKTLRSPGYGAGEEVERVMALSPNWIAGVQNGKPVRVQFTIPVSFALNTDTANSEVVNKNNSLGLDNVVVTGYAQRTDTTKKLVNVVLLPPAGYNALYIVDGEEMDADFDLKLIDARTIKSINILKDKSAVAIYGPKGANGVIIITTKKKKK